MPSHIAFSADSKIAFVTLQDSDEVVAIDLADQSVAVEAEDRRACRPASG